MIVRRSVEEKAMRYKTLLIGACLCFVAASCGKKTDAVFFVQRDEIKTVGNPVKEDVGVSVGGSGLSLDIKMAGNVVVFRSDGNFHGLAGKAGKAYRINEGCMFNTSKGLSNGCKLEEFRTVDLSRSDSEIAAEFGVYDEKTENKP